MTETATRLDHLDEDGIRRLVDGFYGKVRADAELGPVFAGVIQDWQPHLDKLYAFWSSVMLKSGSYKGNPVIKHAMIPSMKPEMFARWLTLFHETCSEQFDDAISGEFRIRAERIAESLRLALYYRPDRPWPSQVAP